MLVRVILFLLFPLFSFAQSDLSGRWTGFLRQDNVVWSFVMTAELVQSGSSITGLMKCIAPDGRYSLISIRGNIEGNQVKLSDNGVLEENISTPSLRLCIKNYAGTFSSDEYKWTIEGSWENNGTKSFANGRYYETNFTCLPGVFSLEKTMEKPLIKVEEKSAQPPDSSLFLNRKVEVQKRFEILSDSVQLIFYDNGAIDDDTISVFLNKQPVVTKKRLTASPLVVPVKLQPGIDNEIIMYAENVGTIPPNTALLVFFDHDQRFEFTIDSDTGKSGTVLIRKRDP